MFRFLNKFLFIIIIFTISNTTCLADNPSIISLSPAITEIIYAINAQNDLIAVSTTCDYPQEVKTKAKAGDSYFIDKEKSIIGILRRRTITSSCVKFPLKKVRSIKNLFL